MKIQFILRKLPDFPIVMSLWQQQVEERVAPKILTFPEDLGRWPEPPRFLVEWSSPWEEFKSALRPALARSPKRLAGEAPLGIFPYRGILASWVLECLLVLALIFLPGRFSDQKISTLPKRQQFDVIYYSGDELPQTTDQGGAQSGASGRAGGEQAHHRTQAIRVARGDRPVEKIVDAPKVNLPHSDSPVANLLAFKSNPGPPPAEGLRSSLTAPALPAMAMTVAEPSPEVNSTSLRSSNAPTVSIVAPAPDVSSSSHRTSPSMSASIVPPTPSVSRDKMRSGSSINSTVVAPPVREAPRDLASSRVPLTPTVDVVAPPVSAPKRDSSQTAKLSLPAPAVVAPPPSQVSRDLDSWGGTATGDIRTKPVPPPPSAMGGNGRNSAAAALSAQVVPPAPAGLTGTGRNAGGAGLKSDVVPPPASLGGRQSSGTSGSGRENRSGGVLVGSADIVPPPPGLGGRKAPGGSGRGNQGVGAGNPLDLGSSVAPPSKAGGNTAGTGVVISNQPGSKAGIPSQSGGGALAMDPTGTAKTGLGGSGGGAGIGKGNGPGSGMTSAGSGAGREGAGRGSDPAARGGISPYPGSGGAGAGTNGTPAVAGVSVQGGTTTVNLPSFGDPQGDAPTGPGRSNTSVHKGSGITIEATPRSGGVFAYYDVLKGDRNYSIYIETTLGTAVMQYADAASAAHPTSLNLTAPEPMRKDLPLDLRPTHVVIACIVTSSGEVKDLKVLEPGAADTTSKILAALHSWKFRPAFRGDEPVEVNAILGFGVDTR